MKKNIFLLLMMFIMISYKSQTVTVRGIARDSLKTIGMGISVNDTIRKFRDKAFKNKEFKEKHWNEYDKLVNNKDLFTYPDSVGNYTINAKLTDTLYFYKRKYTTQKYKVADIIKKNIKVILSPAPCITRKKCDQKIPQKLYSFIGEKINVSDVDTSKYCGESMDSQYKAEYKIIKEFSEHYPDSKIVFTAYDHNSSYEYMFQNYDNVLIFVGDFCGDLIHMKYQFFPVYKTKDGRWASPVKTSDEPYYKSDKYVPIDIAFDESVSFNLLSSNSIPTEEQIAQLKKFKYPEKYYLINDGKAYPIMGRYAEDLVKLWNELYWKK